MNYTRFDWYRTAHHKRFEKRVEKSKLVCQECRGSGGYIEPVLDYGEGPSISCGLCEGTGKLTPYLRGLWLKWKREERNNE